MTLKFIEKIKKRRVKRCRKALLRSTGTEYADLFNRKAGMLGVAARASWDGHRYAVTDSDMPGLTYVFRHEKQGHLAYSDGFLARAENLGQAYFLDSIDFRDGDTVFDCGANLGDLMLWFKHKGLAVNYVGFEPSPVEYDCTRQNVAPHTVHNVGLWNADDELTFYVSSQGADSSLIEPAEYDEKITVQTKRIESFVEGKVKLLKLEAEGAEPEILEGAGEALKDIEYISADLGFERGKAAASTLVPVTNFLLSRNFELMNVRHRRICALYRNKAFG